MLAEQADWLNKAGARQFWVYSRRRRRDAVLLRTLDVQPRLARAEREAVREASGARYGNELAAVQAELRLRYRWLEERRYRLKPRQRERRAAGAAANPRLLSSPEPDAAPGDPFA